MKLRRLLILCTILLFSFSVVTANEHYISEVTGLTPEGTIPTDGSTVTFTIALNNTGPGNITGITNGFRVYSPTGAEWTTTVGAFTGTITTGMLENTFVNPFSDDGIGADTVGFGGFRLFAPGIPVGFNQDVWTITIGPVDASFNGGEICIDSSYYPPAGAWTWSTTEGDVFPDWAGPSCYVIGAPPTPPSINPIGDLDINECETLEFTVTAVDTSGQDLIYSLDILTPPLPTGATFDDNGNNTGTFTWTPDSSQSGSYDIEFIASIGEVADTALTTITVNDNSAPTVTASGPFTAPECQEYTFTVPGNDPEGQPLTYSMSNDPSGATLDPNTGEFVWTPAFGDNTGSPYNITFTVEDICGETGNTVVTFNVPADQAPVFNATPGPFTKKEGVLVNFTLDATDPDGSQITYSTTDPDMPGDAVLVPATGEFNWTPPAGSAGNYVITFIATDACDLTVTVDVTIDVIADVAPVFTAAGPFTIKECDSLEITLSATDPDGDDTEIRYSITNPPAGSTLDDVTGVFNWIPTSEDAAVYNLDFVATDVVGTEAHLVVNVTVDDDQAPIINGGATIFIAGNDTTITECGTVGFVLAAVDPEGTLAGIIFEDGLPEGAIYDQASGEFSWTPVAGQGGSTYTLKIRAIDECNTVTSLDVNITVDANPPPTLDAIGNKTVNECTSTLSFVVTGTDFVLLEFVNGAEIPGATFVSGTATFTWEEPDITNGDFSYVAKFVATDDCGIQSDTLNVNITVNPFAKPPIDALSDKSIFVCRTVTFDANSNDTTVEYGLASIPDPDGALFDKDNGEFSWTPEIDQAGTYELKFFTVNECGSVSDTEFVELTVKENNPPVFITPENDTTIADANWSFIDSNSIELYAEDPDGFRITYLATPLPAGGHLVDNETDFIDSGMFVWFYGEAPTGVYDITFYVEDVCGVMDSVKVTFDIATGIGTKDGLALPETYYLGQNYPNPFNPYTMIEFGLPEKSNIDLAVYNLLGQRIKTLVNESLPANNYVFEWDGTNENGVKVASGVYLYKLISDNYTETKKMIMLK